jgi:hypothetical protein
MRNWKFLKFLGQVVLSILGCAAVLVLFLWAAKAGEGTNDEFQHDQDCGRARSEGASQYQKNFYARECGGG